MTKQRTERLNSLLQEVLSEVIRRDVRNPKIPTLLSVTRVDITKDLSFAKVYISFIGDNINTKEAINALQSAAGFIGVAASRKVVMRTFPTLKFVLDDSVQQHLRIEKLLTDISTEEKQRGLVTPADRISVSREESDAALFDEGVASAISEEKSAVDDSLAGDRKLSVDVTKPKKRIHPVDDDTTTQSDS